MFEELSYNLRNNLIIRSGTIRKSVIIASVIILVLSIPSYFLGGVIANFSKRFWFDDQSILSSQSQAVGQINVSETQIVELVGGVRDFYVSISNKENRNIGFSPFNYTIQLLNSSNQVIFQETRSEFLLPDETKFVTLRSTDPQAYRIEILQNNDNSPKIYNPDNNSIARNPNIEIRQSRLTELDNGLLQINAQFKNNDIVRIDKVDVLYIIRDTRQSVVGIGNFQFNGFVAGELRDLTITYPKPLNREARIIDIRVRVNYLDDGNFTR
jgi:hypothetical protein